MGRTKRENRTRVRTRESKGAGEDRVVQTTGPASRCGAPVTPDPTEFTRQWRSLTRF